jgi:hypothetical protein
VLGVFVILLPAVIGVCANLMLCRSTIKPTLIWRILAIAASLVGLLMAQRKAELVTGS